MCVWIMRRTGPSLLAAALLCAPVVARAGDAPFGAQGQVVVGAASTLGGWWTRYDSKAEFVDLVVSPAIDVFVLRNFALGLDGDGAFHARSYYRVDDAFMRSVGGSADLGARVSLNVPIASWLSVMPQARVGVGYEGTHYKFESVQELALARTTRVGPWVSLYVPLLLHPRPHFFIGVGPALSHSFERDGARLDVAPEHTWFTGRVVFGGYWGGAEEPARAPAAPTTKKRFGDGGVFTVSGGAFVSVMTYTPYPSTVSESAWLEGSYFVSSRISVGLRVSERWAKGTSGEPTLRAPESYEESSFTVGPRLGVDIPLTPFMSLYPTGDFGFGREDSSSTYPGGSKANASLVITARLYAPLLIHPARHAYLGFGPTFAADVTRRNERYGNENKMVQIGGAFTIGTWF